MLEEIAANRMVLAATLVLVLLVGWWLLTRARKQAPRERRPDVLDEGAEPAQRNQALIDAAPAAQVPPAVAAPASGIMAGIGEVIAAAHEDLAEEARPAPAAAPSETGDDLTRIKGLGPKIRTLLAGLGVTSFAQVAAWSDADLARIDAQLGAFAGRPARDNWIEQAKLLAAGDTAGFEDRFGKI